MKEFTCEEARKHTRARGANTKFWVNQKDLLSPHYFTLKKNQFTIRSSLLSKNTCVIKFHKQQNKEDKQQ